MEVSYKKLWKLLIDKDMKKKDQDDWRTTFINEFNRNDRVKQNLFNAEEETDKVMNRINAYYDKKSK